MDCDVIVVGAGLVGAALARALRGVTVRVVSQAPHVAQTRAPEDFDPRVYAISPGNVAFLRELKAWQAVPEERIAPVHAMRVFGDDGEASISFDALRAGVPELAWIVEDGALQDALWRGLEASHAVSVEAPARCAALEVDAQAARLRLEDGRTLAARLVVGADGADSFVRHAARIPARLGDYGQSAVVAHFACGRPHRNVAHQWFQGGPVLALLPLPGERVSMVWSLPQARAEAVMALAPEALCRAVEEASQGLLGELALESTPRAFVLRRLSAARAVAPRVALAGDAAHVVHPLAGQGANLGLQDARSLAAVLEAREPVRDPGDLRLLRRYARARAEPVLATDAMVHGLYALYEAQGGTISRLRQFGLNLTDRLPVLKNLLMRQAMS